ncbi:hypothetical protein Tco_0676014 [Tanacetum coccineum]
MREGVFCYRKLPFGLKNAGATYQKLVDKVFNNRIGHNLEVQVDDMVIKSDFEEDMLVNIQETFDKLRAINMKLIPRNALSALKKGLQWTTEADEAFRKMKELIETLPICTAPIKGETLVMYLAASEESISVVLLAERGKNRRLQRYFQPHPIQILIDKPIKQILTRPKKSGGIAKWEIKLGEHEIEFHRRNSVKGHILVEFLTETPSVEDKETEAEKATDKEPKLENAWKLYTDGASTFDGSRAV